MATNPISSQDDLSKGSARKENEEMNYSISIQRKIEGLSKQDWSLGLRRFFEYFCALTKKCGWRDNARPFGHNDGNA